ncbi:uncharacterized protein LOC110821713 [Carica papaya]|uniref:uncharacterized protein LOC110821713 n=1 Tax=Carica papaya TaxID=3649 RepID=UPI000B8C7BDF|nr:uncharacterized protein LOC110821713 [Carica papaya]
MCGRAQCTLRADDIPRACHRNNAPVRFLNTDRYRPSYNVSPGWNLSVVRRDGGAESEGVVVHCMKWGLIPSFTKKSEKPDFYKMFNARSESISEKASFRRLLPKNRCLIAVEGFYEWKKHGSKKQPYYIHFKDGRPLVFAALYDSWENSEGEILDTFTIVTTSSSSRLRWLHDRMPVILADKASTDTWLNISSTPKFDSVLKPYEKDDLVWYPVTPAMGKPSFDGPECIKEIPLKKEEKNQILKFFSTKESRKEGSKRHEENPLDESVKTGFQKNLKEEPETEDFTENLKEELQTGNLKEEPQTEDPAENLKEEPKTEDLTENLKEEPETEDNREILSLTKMENNDPEPGDSIYEGAVKVEKKRDREELLADQKSVVDKVESRPWPVKKKGKLKSTDDKQPTLLSYFGKK